MRWRREVDKGREQESEGGGRSRLRVEVGKHAWKRWWVLLFGWLGPVKGMAGDQTRGVRRPQNPMPGSRKRGLGGSQGEWCAGKLCFGMGPASCSGGQLDGLHYRPNIRWRGQNVGK